MKRRNLFIATLLVAAGAFMFSSCDNAENNERIVLADVEIESAEDDAVVDDIYNSLDGEIDQEIAGMDLVGYQTSGLKSSGEELYPCKIITIDHPDSTTFPKVITIDYGDGCTIEINGETFTRKGKIEITITNRWFLPGAIRASKFIDFYVNDIKIEGTRTIENKGENAEGNIEFAITLTDGKISFNDTLIYKREAERTKEWVRAANPLNDIWYIEGGCSGVNLDGYEYSHLVTEKLMVVRCEELKHRWTIVQGVVEIVKNGNTATIDYGNGTCDNAAILTINGEEKEIEVCKRYHHKRKLFVAGN